MSKAIDFGVRPADYSDAGNAAMFQVYYHGLLAYTDALGWLSFNGKNWEKNEHMAVSKDILSWAIQGAGTFIRNGFKLHVPDIVAMATEEYQSRENWLENFINERCIKDFNR